MSEDWADSPEAYFLTAGERAEWKGLDSRFARDAFKERYWLRRDPTPGTERNEFREMVLARIRTADARFGIGRTPGSRTARGFVFVVFGSPARVQDTHAPPPPAPRFPSAGVGFQEGTETTSLWIYDRERTPRVLEALGVPSLEVQIVLEPNRRSDSLQSPGLVHEMRDRLARKTIVNPDLIPPASETAGAAAPGPLPRALLDVAARGILGRAPLVSRSGASVFGEAVLWRESGGPETLVWFSLPPSAGGAPLRLHGVVRRQGSGEEIASLSEPAALSAAFSTADLGEVVLRRLALPPGAYEAAFAVTEGSGARVVASAAARLSVPDLGSGFAVSSLLLTRGPGRPEPGDDSPFAIGPALLPPRADATFSAAEGLWCALEIANAPDPSRVTLEVRLRKGAETLRSVAPFSAPLERFAPDRYLCGFELRPADLPPGDYRLYVLARDGVAPPEAYLVRAADFRLRP